MQLSISGSTGLVGRELINKLTGDEWTFRIISRDSIKMPDEEFLEKKIEGADAVINLAGAPIIKHWTEAYKKEILDSRISTTRKIATAIRNAKVKPPVFISASAIGIYDSVNTHDEESTSLADDFLGKVCSEWEAEAMAVSDLTRVVIIRLGVVLSSKGGALKKAHGPFSFGLGGVIGSGQQAFSFIHIRDLIKIYQAILENKNITGVVNAVAPESTNNYHFTKTLGKVLNQMTIFKIPESALRLIYGDAAVTLTEGQKVVPAKLMKNGFQFEFPTIEKALLNIYRV
ncbi:MAG: TIGR01777 family oxidoreductase [Bacteroidetes bacterium]|nr:TIGR01777 family oxidoreductase [Bacteroidota bacterium]